MARKSGGELAAENDLVREWEKQRESCGGTKNVRQSVSLIVRDPLKPPAKLKLVARKGKLEIDEEEMGKDPNGTEFAIAVNDSPELDNSALVVGRVVEGMDVVDRIRQVKTVQENTTSPYFRYTPILIFFFILSRVIRRVTCVFNDITNIHLILYELLILIAI